MLDNQGYRHTFITFNTYFLLDGKNGYANARFTFTYVACLVNCIQSLCYSWSCLLVYSPQQIDTAVANLPLTHIVPFQPLLNLLDLPHTLWCKMKSNYRSLGTQRQTRRVVPGDTWSILWADRDIPRWRQADDHTTKHGTVIREMAIGGCDGELATLSVSANALTLSPPTDPRSTDMFHILQIIPKPKQKVCEK